MKETANTQALRAKVAAALKVPGMSQKRLAKDMGMSDSRLSQWRKGTYNSPAEPIEQEIMVYFQSKETQTDLSQSLPEGPEWVATPTAMEIYEKLSFAQALSTQVIIYGAAGMSKTVTCNHYKQNNPNVWMITPTGVTSSKSGILNLLCKALKLDGGKTVATLQENCINRMKEVRNGLIIIDEAQQLPPASMDLMRQVAEQAGVGLAYVGNEGVYSQLLAGQNVGKFAQLLSRLTQRRHLLLPEPDDVELLVQEMGVTDSKAVKLLYEISQTPGALRYVVHTVQFAQMAVDQDEQITQETIVDAFQYLTGIRLGRAA